MDLGRASRDSSGFAAMEKDRELLRVPLRSQANCGFGTGLSGLHWFSVGFPAGSVGEESAFNALDTGDTGLIPGSGRSPGGRQGNPL